ncbi:MAG: peptidase M6, partial [Muribaculaceae bacterium]|nr:peptidase M6 [Muribaculaceae bacterium]
MLKKVLTLVCAGLMGASACFAVPADPRPFVVTQPDGSTLTVRMIGDEFFHCMMTEDGYLVKRSSDGVYYF